MTNIQARNQAIGASKSYINQVLAGITLINGKNLEVDSIVYNDTDKQTEVNVSWTSDTTGLKKTDVIKIPYGNGFKNVDIEADEENYNYFVFTDDKDVQTKVKLPEGLKVKLSEKEGNAITQLEDGLYVSLSGVKISTKENNALENLSGDEEGLYVEGLKISEAEGNKLEKKDDGLFSSGVDVSSAEGNQIETKDDGIYVAAQKISEDENNLIESKDDGLFVTVPISAKEKNKLNLVDDGYYAEGVTVSEDAKNIIEELDDGIYVENITIEKTALADNTTKCDFKYKDTLLNSFILDNKSTLISGHVQQFGSAETVNVYKYVSGGVTVLSTSLIESTSDNTIVYDSNLRKFGVIKVDGDKFYIIGKEAVKFDIDLSKEAEPKTLHNEGFNLVLVLDNEDYNVFVDVNSIMSEITRAEFDDLKNTVASIQLNQYPNAIIHGSPSIMHGQVSGFSASNYLEFPFIVNFGSQDFIINMCFNTSDDITNQQNIIDGLGLALAIKDSGFLLALSSTGITFDIGIFNSSPVLTANTTYYVQFKHSNNQYILSYSTNKIDYTDVITVDSTLSLYPVKTIIGVGDLNTAQPKPFKGIIDFNYCNLIVAGDELWQGIKSIVNVSKEENNAIEMLSDGLYVEETKISEEANNTLKLLNDGLFSGKEIISIKREDYNKLTPEEKQKDVIYNVYDDESKALVIDDNNIDKTTLWSSFKINSELEKIPVKTELLTAALTEEQILERFVQNPNVNYSGFFYNIALASYCSFNGLYISKHTSGTEVHYGEVEIKGIHDNSDYSIDYRCDWEDGATWYKVINANINDDSVETVDTWSAKKINDTFNEKSDKTDLDKALYNKYSAGNNILDMRKRLSGTFNISADDVLTNTSVDVDRSYFDFTLQLAGSSLAQKSIANLRLSNTTTKTGNVTFTMPTEDYTTLYVKHNGAKYDLNIGIFNVSDLGIEKGKTYTVHVNCDNADPLTVGGIVITELSIVEGSSAGEYHPYVPSLIDIYKKFDATFNKHTLLDSASISTTAKTFTLSEPMSNFSSIDIIPHGGSAVRGFIRIPRELFGNHAVVPSAMGDSTYYVVLNYVSDNSFSIRSTNSIIDHVSIYGNMI